MKTDFSKLVRQNIRSLRPYRSARDEFRGQASVYLDANENPFPSNYHRYPDARQESLRKNVSAFKHVTSKEILLTNGSDEAIDLLIRAFCRPGIDNVVVPNPTYGMYSTWAAVNDIQVREAPLTAMFQLDKAAVKKAVNSKTRIVFLCSPNNPSGNLLQVSAIRWLLKFFPGIVVIDEAYVDFAGTESWLRELSKYPNLVVLQTFSKAWGLAGIRMGICAANPDIIQVLEKIKPPYNISSAAEEVVRKALRTRQNRMRKQVDAIIQERNKLEKALRELRIVNKVYPSDANFLLARVTDAKAIYEALLLRGIVVRLRSDALRCENCLRISVGTPIENRRLISTLRSL